MNNLCPFTSGTFSLIFFSIIVSSWIRPSSVGGMPTENAQIGFVESIVELDFKKPRAGPSQEPAWIALPITMNEYVGRALDWTSDMGRQST
jgi:hypothetical protein